MEQNKTNLEKILVGDDQIDFAKKNFPSIPNAEIEFVADPNELIKKAQTGNYTMVVTDLNYTENGEEGYKVLEALKDSNLRRVLWTGNAYDKGVMTKGKSLGAEVLDKDEIGALVGQVVSKEPLKKDGKVLIYTNEKRFIPTLKKTKSLFFDEEKVVVSSDLHNELSSGKYGLVIDTTPMMNFSKEKSSHGSVAHDLKYLKLAEVPRVVTINDSSKFLVEMLKYSSQFFNKQ